MPLESLSASPAFASMVTELHIAAPFVSVAALLIALLCFIMLLSVRTRLSRLALTKSGSLEESIAVLSREMKDARHFRAEIEDYLKLVEVRLRGSVSGVGVVRFNPFSGEGSGGNQSFSVALLDEMQSGIVLSSLYTRDRASVYCKPIQAGISTYELTDEEKEAIHNAKLALTTRKEPRQKTTK